MVRPARFSFNPDTAGNNAFQHDDLPADHVSEQAVREFDAYVDALRAHGVTVEVVQDRAQPHTPDSIFPNNGFSTHPDGLLVLYPMQGENRRLERGKGAIEQLAAHYDIVQTWDFTSGEAEGHYLEGTGSLVLDHDARVAYACRSVRTHEALLDTFAAQMDFRVVAFDAHDARGVPVYHTNVMMSVGRTLAPVCLDAIGDLWQRSVVREGLENADKQVLPLTLAQLDRFAGNMLEIQGGRGQPLLVMSRSAWHCLDTWQRTLIERHAEPLVVTLDTIERVGGGSARCMLAEIRLPRKAVRA